jgi:hypothetical protein
LLGLLRNDGTQNSALISDDEAIGIAPRQGSAIGQSVHHAFTKNSTQASASARLRLIRVLIAELRL